MTKHEPRRLVQEVDFVTAAMPAEGDLIVVTDLAILELKDGALEVASIHPDTTPDTIRERTSWDIDVPSGTPVTKAVTPEEISILRQLDPEGLYSPTRS